ncbi:hypothetical protein GCM10012275_21300 [Longimycelium tulufanense]|uniref:TVP38/TMEM64 family membrane protein n=1 Tax=Longimycelium tulufanense TaxID=907463 RepID=A0A8J3CAD4_9PSEU|nr:TVP38/TMEM64 family protein [Longimycelium tulufanense]GGM50188.1 hypothetical protein GCM10012275_21300 [Longimycelium tulufanense]
MTAPESASTSQRPICLAGLAVAATAIVAAAFALPVPDTATVQEWVQAAGALAPLVYLGCYVIAATVLVPRPLLSAAGGVLFGPAAGIALAVAGATMAAIAGFGLARALGRDLVAPRLRTGALSTVDHLLARHGWIAVLQLRLVPLVPFSAVNYACGVTALPARQFAAGTAIGSVPGTALVVVAGASLQDPTSPGFLGPLGLALLTSIATAVVARRRGRVARASTRTGAANASAVGPLTVPPACRGRCRL